MARKQVPDLGSPVSLATPAPVTGYYAPPPKPMIDNRAAELVKSLGTFNSALNRFGAVTSVAQRKQQSAVDQAAAARFRLTHTNEQYKGAIRSGEYPLYRDQTANEGIAKGYGNILATEISKSIDDGITSGRINLLDPHLNVDQLLTDYSKSALEDVDKRFADPHQSQAAIHGLAATLAPLRTSLIAKREEALTKQNLHERLGTTNNALDTIIKTATPVEESSAGEVAQNNIRTAYKELQGTFDLPPQWIDQQLIAVLGNNAQTHPEVVLHVLTAPRTDEKGNKLPPLIANPAYSKESQTILTTVNTALAKKTDAEAKEQYVQEMLKSLVSGDSAILSRHDHSYYNPYSRTIEDVPAEATLKTALARYQTNSDTIARQRFESADAQFERDFPVYHKANLPGPWQKVLEGVPAIITNPAALTNSDSRQQGIEAGELWMKLGAKDYNYLVSTTKLNDRAKDFYQTYEVARRYLGRNQDQALDAAATVVNTPGGTTPGGVDRASVQKKLQEKIDSDFSSPDFHIYNPYSWIFHSEGAANKGQIKRQVTAIARLVARIDGVAPEDAVTYAEQYVKDHSTIINGHAIMERGYLPAKDLQAYIPPLLEQFVKQHHMTTGVKDVSKLTIKPFSKAGIFRIVDRSNPIERPLFVLDENGHATPAIITVGMIQRMKAEEERATVDANNEAALNTFNDRPNREQRLKDATILLSPAGSLTGDQIKRRQVIVDKSHKMSFDFGAKNILSPFGKAYEAKSAAEKQVYGDIGKEVVRRAGNLPASISYWLAKAYDNIKHTPEALKRARIKK